MNIDQWSSYKAKWWQFWFPQSGLPGGLITGMIIVLLFTILHWYWF